MGATLNAANFFRSRGLSSVAGRTYPGTYAIVRRDSFFAEQVANRDSATWKKAEHIVIDEVQSDGGRSILPRWKMLTAAEPIGRSFQKLYVAVDYDRYAKYDAEGSGLAIGHLSELFQQ